MTPRAERLIRWLGLAFGPFSIGITDLKLGLHAIQTGQDALNQKVSEMATKADIDAALATLKITVETALGDLKTAIANNAASTAAATAADYDAVVASIGAIQTETATAIAAVPVAAAPAPATPAA